MPGQVEPHRRQAVSEIREALATADTLTEEDRRALLSLSFLEFPAVITAHRGHLISEKLESLTVARRQFDLSCDDLFDLLKQFHEISGRPGFHSRSGRKEFRTLVDRLRKELFTLSDLAHSIQDLCRRVRKAWDTPNFIEKMKECFGDDGLHDFMIDLRNALHHQRVFEPNWELRWTATGGKESSFKLDRAELLAEPDAWTKGKAWLEAQPDDIDIRSTVEEYRRRHHSFYEWYLGTCDTNLPAAVAEYHFIRDEQQRSLIRAQWQSFLPVFISRGVDPMNHLEKHLTVEEWQIAKSLPPKSEALVDYVIGCVDELEACTEVIRAMAYKFFDVPGATWQPAPPVVVKVKLFPGPPP